MSDDAETTAAPHTPADDAPKPIWWCITWLAAVGVFLGIEASRLAQRSTIIDWFLQSDIDVLVYFTLLVAAPLIWCFRRDELHAHGEIRRSVTGQYGWFLAVADRNRAGSCWRPLLLSVLVGLASLAASALVGTRFDELPPAYHDEYSYLFQAQTFLAGRASFPSHPAARIFDQMHVLNEGHFASRYFPGTGLWMAPFVAAGHPYYGHWLAGAACAVLIFWIGREIAGDGAGLIAGLLTACSPGMALFSNLLLAHHPTLVGLGVFIFGFLRLIRSGPSGALSWGLLSGTGLAFAMLCRPMTAAGVALPFGIYLVHWAFQRVSLIGKVESNCTDAGPPRRIGHVADAASIGASSLARNKPKAIRIQRPFALLCLGLPLLCAGGGLFAFDKAITGSGWLTPYSLYTDLHTPRHAYGFNNVERGKQRQGSRVIKNYDQWAENLTPRLAAANAGKRLVASAKWTLGLIPLTLALAGGIVLWKRLPTFAWLILAGIVSLHAAHVPYWFVGMEDHHYVFEAGPLWSVWVAVVSIAAFRAWQVQGHVALCVWWGVLLAAAIVMNVAISSGVWSAPLEQGIGRVAFARIEHGRFLKLVASRAVPRPALVLVDSDPADRHIEYIANSPELTGPVLIGRYLPETVPLQEVRRLFPDRSLFVYRIRNVYRNGVRVPQEEWRQIK
jgi:hypothetical protein